MKRLLICLAMVLVPAFSYAGNSSDAVLGGGVGGFIGAVVGNEIGGRDGAIIGGAIGAAAGVAITTDNDHHRDYYHRDRYSRYDRRDGYHDRHYDRREAYYDRGNYDRGYYDRKDDSHHFYAPPHGYFVPPGQAKKGHW